MFSYVWCIGMASTKFIRVRTQVAVCRYQWNSYFKIKLCACRKKYALKKLSKAFKGTSDSVFHSVILHSRNRKRFSSKCALVTIGYTIHFPINAHFFSKEN